MSEQLAAAFIQLLRSTRRQPLSSLWWWYSGSHVPSAGSVKRSAFVSCRGYSQIFLSCGILLKSFILLLFWILSSFIYENRSYQGWAAWGYMYLYKCIPLDRQQVDIFMLFLIRYLLIIFGCKVFTFLVFQGVLSLHHVPIKYLENCHIFKQCFSTLWYEDFNSDRNLFIAPNKWKTRATWDGIGSSDLYFCICLLFEQKV